mmetsp:Transcript_104393/g.301997  ORF Transcript_104393/g.301997 Transcript_104393/m.301997 type:complete len:301 (+) Transcript_104393:225-1127(+)
MARAHRHEELHCSLPMLDAFRCATTEALPTILVDRYIPDLANPTPWALTINVLPEVYRAGFLDGDHEVQAIDEHEDRADHDEEADEEAEDLAKPVAANPLEILGSPLFCFVPLRTSVQKKREAHRKPGDGAPTLQREAVVLFVERLNNHKQVKSDDGGDHDESRPRKTISAAVHCQIREVHADHGVGAARAPDDHGVRIIHSIEQRAADDAHLEHDHDPPTMICFQQGPDDDSQHAIDEHLSHTDMCELVSEEAPDLRTRIRAPRRRQPKVGLAFDIKQQRPLEAVQTALRQPIDAWLVS